MYKVISGVYTSADGVIYESFGIAMEGAARGGEMADLSLDRAAVEALVTLCNRLAVPMENMREIAEDFVAVP